MLAILNNPLLLGPLTAILMQALKASPLPFEGKTKAGMLAALTIVAVLVEVGVALLNGTPEHLDLGALLPRLVDAGVVLLSAAGVYSLGKFVTKS